MPINISKANLETLSSELRAVVNALEPRFGHLTAEQLNWKPNRATWSLNQCFEHIMLATAGYFDPIEQILAGTKSTTFWERIPFFPALFGSFLIKSLEPGAKVAAPPAFQPTPSPVPTQASLLPKLVQQQRDVLALMERCRSLDCDQLIVTSPAAAFVTYSLIDAFRIITVHAQHHLAQTGTLVTMTEFPKA